MFNNSHAAFACRWQLRRQYTFLTLRFLSFSVNYRPFNLKFIVVHHNSAESLHDTELTFFFFLTLKKRLSYQTNRQMSMAMKKNLLRLLTPSLLTVRWR